MEITKQTRIQTQSKPAPSTSHLGIIVPTGYYAQHSILPTKSSPKRTNNGVEAGHLGSGRYDQHHNGYQVCFNILIDVDAFKQTTPI